MLGAHTMEKRSTDCGGDFRFFIGDILKPLQLQPPDWLAGLLEPSAHTPRRAATRVQNRRPAVRPLPPANSAGQSTEKIIETPRQSDRLLKD